MGGTNQATEPQRKAEVLVLGSGAVGILYSYFLQNSGLATVTAVARSDYNVLKEFGTTIKSEKLGTIPDFKADRLVRSPADIPEDIDFDYILCCFKFLPDVNPSEDIIKPYIKPNAVKQPTIVLMQNGIGVENPVQQAFPEHHVMSGSIWISGNLLEGGRVLIHSEVERVNLGLYTGENIAIPESFDKELPPELATNPFAHKRSPLLENLKSGKVVYTEERVKEGNEIAKKLEHILRQGGSEAFLFDNVQPERWSKNLVNTIFNSCCCLVRAPWNRMLKPHLAADALRPLRAAMTEAVVVGKALGYTEASGHTMEENMEHGIDIVASIPDEYKPSTLMDLEKSKPMEVECIIGGVVERAYILRIPVPKLEMIYALMRVEQNLILEQSNRR